MKRHRKSPYYPCTGVAGASLIGSFFVCAGRLNNRMSTNEVPLDAKKELILPILIPFVIAIVAAFLLYSILTAMFGKEQGKKIMRWVDGLAYIVPAILFIIVFVSISQ